MNHHSGRLEVICGSMFSGKTEEMIRRLRRAVIAKQNVQVFKPEVDNRSGNDKTETHFGVFIEAQAVKNSKQILDCLQDDTTVVAIDEVQFFDEGILQVVQHLADNRIRVIAAGLDMDFRGEPFGSMPELLCRAEDVTKLHAICVKCGEAATRSQRLVNGKPAHYDDPIVVIGAQESYEARCREHHEVPNGRQDFNG